MPTARMEAIIRSTSTLVEFVGKWDTLRQHPDVCDFAFGNPQEVAIPGFAESLARHLAPEDKDWYAYKRSEPEARAVVAKRLTEWRGLPFEDADIAMTPGAFGAIAVALHALLDRDDEVIFSVPPWFFYEAMILAAGGTPVKVPVMAIDHDLDVDAIAAAITPRTRIVIVNTPNNPTGRIYPPATLEDLARILTEASDRYGAPIYLLSDEPYSKLVFSDAEFTSPSRHYAHTLISYSYGKILLAPGQRIGWLAWTPQMPEREALRSGVFMAQVSGGWLFPSAIMQCSVAELDRLSIDLVELEGKRDLLVTELRRAGYDLRSPEGTFYLWARSPQPDDLGFARDLAEQGVLVLPGATCASPGYFRISLTATPEMVERGLPVFHRAVSG